MDLIYKDSVFSYYQGRDGKDRGIIQLDNLFRSNQDRTLFESKWQSFLSSDSANAHVLSRSANALVYRTESIIPSFCGSKPSLLLLFGNPAPHSVKAGVMFSSERTNREHRIWRFLAETGVLSFNDRSSSETCSAEGRVRQLLTTGYDSPFQIAMASFVSFPSTASNSRWSGVAGIKSLLGARAFKVLCDSEFGRLRIVLRRLMPEKGIVVAFQKDAFSSLRSTHTPVYSLRSSLSGSLIGSIRENPNIFLGAAPPTRLILSSQAKSAFIKIAQEGLKWVASA